jgi:hypothetical protein
MRLQSIILSPLVSLNEQFKSYILHIQGITFAKNSSERTIYFSPMATLWENDYLVRCGLKAQLNLPLQGAIVYYTIEPRALRLLADLPLG